MNNPYIVCLIVGLVLFFLCVIFVSIGKFIRFVLFLVYIGGVMVLISYCVMLLPSAKFERMAVSPLYCALLLPFVRPVNRYSYGLLYSWSCIFLIVLLLFLVILSVVDIVDYSSGMMKYV